MLQTPASPRNDNNSLRSTPISIPISTPRDDPDSPTSPSLRQMSGGIESMHFHERMLSGNSTFIGRFILHPSENSNNSLTPRTTAITQELNSMALDSLALSDVDRAAELNSTHTTAITQEHDSLALSGVGRVPEPNSTRSDASSPTSDFADPNIECFFGELDSYMLHMS